MLPVLFGNEEKEVFMNTSGAEGWLAVGQFYGRPEKSKISLSAIGESKQVIIGDAVKWIYKEDKK